MLNVRQRCTRGTIGCSPVWLLFKAIGGRDGDNRHWPDIEAWADAIAGGLRG